MTQTTERVITVSQDNYLFYQEAVVENVYNLMEGRVSLWKDGIKISDLNSNHILGFEGLYNPQGLHPYSVYTETDCKFYKFHEKELPEMFFSNSKLGEQVYNNLGMQLNHLWQFIAPRNREFHPAYFVGEIESFRAGEYVIKEGESTDQIYRIISTDQGLEISKQGQIISTLRQPGDFFGEMAAILNEPRSASVRSLGDSVLEIYPSSLLYNILTDYPEIGFRLIRDLSRRLADTNSLILPNGS